MKPMNQLGLAVVSPVITAGVLLSLVAIGYGAATGIGEQIRAYNHDNEWNIRGLIKCEDGKLTVSNIDFSGTLMGPAIDFTTLQKNCNPRGAVEIKTQDK